MPLKPIAIHQRYASPSFWPSIAAWSAELRGHQVPRTGRPGARSSFSVAARRPTGPGRRLAN